MPKSLYTILFISVGCLCGNAWASDSAHVMKNNSFLVSDGLAQGKPGIKSGESPDKTVDGLAAHANDWSEPSPQSEMRYVYAIRQWLDSLGARERAVAREILREAHPRMHTLRIAIREKKSQLAAISFDRHTRPETLPRLGQELQALRSALLNELKSVDRRLREEAGIPMGPLGGDGFWLAPPAVTPRIDHPAPQVPPPSPPEKKDLSHGGIFRLTASPATPA